MIQCQSDTACVHASSFRISRVAGPQDRKTRKEKFEVRTLGLSRNRAFRWVTLLTRFQSDASWHCTSLSWSKSISPPFTDSTAVQCVRELWPMTPPGRLGHAHQAAHWAPVDRWDKTYWPVTTAEVSVVNKLSSIVWVRDLILVRFALCSLCCHCRHAETMSSRLSWLQRKYGVGQKVSFQFCVHLSAFAEYWPIWRTLGYIATWQLAWRHHWVRRSCGSHSTDGCVRIPHSNDTAAGRAATHAKTEVEKLLTDRRCVACWPARHCIQTRQFMSVTCTNSGVCLANMIPPHGTLWQPHCNSYDYEL